jgi:hypothetical protein
VLKLHNVIDQFSQNLSLFDLKSDDSNNLLKVFENIEIANMFLERNSQDTYAKYCQDRLQTLKNLVMSLPKASGIENEKSNQAFSELTLAVRDLSLTLFSSLGKPHLPKDLDVCSALTKQIHEMDPAASIYESFAKWVSRWETPIADLNWSAEELLKLAPHLSSINLVDYEIVETRLPLKLFLSSCESVKKIQFFANEITEKHLSVLSSLSLLEQIKMSRVSLPNGSLRFDCFPHLTHISLQDMIYTSPQIDLSYCENLQSVHLDHLFHFNGRVILPKINTLENVWIDSFDKADVRLNIEDCKKLKNLHLNHLDGFKQQVDLSQSSELISLKIMCCPQWQGPLILPAQSQLRYLDLQENRKFSGSLSEISHYTSLEQIDLTNCREFLGGIEFSELKNLTELRLVNCFSYLGDVDCSNATKLKNIQVFGCSKIGSILRPK